MKCNLLKASKHTAEKTKALDPVIVVPILCKTCEKGPLLTNLGGVNPTYEVCCPVCKKAVHGDTQAEAVANWSEIYGHVYKK